MKDTMRPVPESVLTEALEQIIDTAIDDERAECRACHALGEYRGPEFGLSDRYHYNHTQDCRLVRVHDALRKAMGL